MIHFSAPFYFLAPPRGAKCWGVQYTTDRALYKGNKLIKLLLLVSSEEKSNITFIVIM